MELYDEVINSTILASFIVQREQWDLSVKRVSWGPYVIVYPQFPQYPHCKKDKYTHYACIFIYPLDVYANLHIICNS